MTNPTAVAVRSNHSKEVADGDEAKPTAAAVDAFYLMRLNLELASAGFAADRRPGRPYEPPPPRPSCAGLKASNPDYERAYRLQRRRRWLLLGIVKPRTDAERALVAEQQRAA